MSNIANETGHIAWLAAGLANKRNCILGLIYRLTGLGSPGSLKPALFAKFSRWLNEIASIKRDEMRIMARIEDVEREHQLMRCANKLKRAAPSRDMTGDYSYEASTGRRPMRSALLMIMLWYLFLRQKINQKKQGLTAD